MLDLGAADTFGTVLPISFWTIEVLYTSSCGWKGCVEGIPGWTCCGKINHWQFFKWVISMMRLETEYPEGPLGA